MISSLLHISLVGLALVALVTLGMLSMRTRQVSCWNCLGRCEEFQDPVLVHFASTEYSRFVRHTAASSITTIANQADPHNQEQAPLPLVAH